jgi:ABC-type antimicrobial peptide transport system permease subunit
VVPDLTDVSLAAAPRPVVYVVNTLNPGWARYADMVVAFGGNAGATGRGRAVVEAARSFDPELPIGSVRTYDQVVASTLQTYRFRAAVLSGFAAIALVLVALGVYGATAQTVQRQRRDLAVRTALGAPTGRLVWHTIRDAATVAAVGTAAGLLLAAGAARLVGHMVYEAKIGDPGTIVGVLAVMAGAVLVAGLIPARRAARTDPAGVLRAE